MKLFSGKMLETLLIEQRRYSEGLLPEIIKRLINCSGAEVDRLRIPDGDDVWAPGYDGIVSAKVESRYITAGKSVWEFGCSSDSLAKIESDFEKRTENSLDIDKANTTFYLVVPKIWAYAKAISEWEAEHREEWKNVIVYDAAILCDWINSELAVAAWLFEIYDKGAHPIAISSISRAWRGFSKWTDPAFTYVMFTEGREEQRAQLMAYCKERQICCVRADTKIGAYGFCLATLMQSADLFDAAIVVQNEDTYHRLCASCKGTIFLLAFPYHGSIPEGNTTIFCTSREMPKRPDEIDLPPLWKTQFIRALCDMGISHSGAEELYISTHGNLWSLIRKIPGSYACAKPKWVDFSNIELLRPLVLLRYYCTTEESDQRLIAKLANVNYSEIERQYAKLSKLEDSPVKRIGERYLIVNREEAWNALGIDISDDSSKCMFDEIKQLVNRIDSVNWLEQQTITSRFHQLLMNYIFFAETGADQRIIDEQLKTLLDSLGGADSSKLLLDELATIAEAAPVLTITFIEHLIDTQLCEIILSQYQDILHALDVLVEIDDTCVRAGTAIFRICKQSFSAAASTAAGEHWLTSPKMKQIYWQHRWMIDYDEQTYQSLLKYNPGGLLMWIYRCIEQQEMDIQKVFEVLYLINKNKCNIDASLLPMIIRKVDNQFYSDEWAELCVNLYYNGFLKHEYGYFPQCMSRYFFRNPDKLLEKIRGDDALYFEFQWHYRLPSEAFFDIGQLLHWTDVMINASDSDADKVTLVGSILGKAPDGDDGIFPIETVRKLLKIKKNEELTTAVARGKINSLGLRDVEDGKKEREKSDIYKMQARAMEIDYPQTSVILRILANFYERESKRDQISSEIEPLQ